VWCWKARKRLVFAGKELCAGLRRNAGAVGPEIALGCEVYTMELCGFVVRRACLWTWISYRISSSEVRPVWFTEAKVGLYAGSVPREAGIFFSEGFTLFRVVACAPDFTPLEALTG